MAVNIKFLADVMNLVKGLGTSKDAIDDNAEALEDVMQQAILLGRQMGKTTDEIARDISDASGVPFDRMKRAVEEVEDRTRDLERAQGDVADAAEDAARSVADSADSAAQKMGDRIKDGADVAAEGLTGLGSIARDILSGEFSSAADGALNALGSIAAAAGVGGVVGSAIMSAISGLVSSAVDELSRMATAAEEAKKEVVNQMIELGGALDDETISRNMEEIVKNADKMANLEILKDATGMSDTSLLRAMAGDSDLAAEAIARLREAADQDAIPDALLLAANKAATELGGIADAADAATPAIDLLKRAQSELAGQANTTGEAVESAFDKVRNVPPPGIAKIGVEVEDRTQAAVSRIVRRINGQVASITIQGKTGRQVMK